jgi:hypothetical protein
MSSLLSVLLNPLIPLNPWWSDDGEDNARGFDIIYPLTACVALGIWLVVNRYQKAQYAAVAFEYEPRDVRAPISFFFCTRSILALAGRRPKPPKPHHRRCAPALAPRQRGHRTPNLR